MLIKFDNLLNRITMYKLLNWGLRILAGISLVLSLFGILHISFWGLVWSLIILSVVSQLATKVLAWFWKVPTNTESYAITLLILYFLFPPVTSLNTAVFIALAAIIAAVSKFVIAVYNRHLFNPAAFAAFVMGLFGLLQPIWWIGSKSMWPFVLILGLIIVRKIRRFSLFLTYLVVALLAMSLSALTHHQEVAQNLRIAFESSPLLFLGSIMLTEPSTMPGRRRQQVIYGALVAVLYGYPWDIGGYLIRPETALLIGNLYAFFVNPHYRLKLRLKEVTRFSDRVAGYLFSSDRKPQFAPGQYMEWTLDMPKHDSRGNRRTFSIASSPTENDVLLGVKFYDPSSRFKQELRTMKPGNAIFAGQIAGDFTLPGSTGEKLVFIAGGIGITPFRSMLKYIIDKDQARDIVMIYAVSDPSEVAFEDVLKAAEAQGVRVIKLLTTDKAPAGWQGSTGKLTPEFIAEHIPDYKQRTFYLSGPQPMIEGLRASIKKLGATKIKTDYFTGY